MFNRILASLTLAFAGCGIGWAAGTPCEGLTGLKLAHTEITSATLVAKGDFKLPQGQGGGGNTAALFATMPGFCRVLGTSRPVADSAIGIEIWLPAEGWNEKLQVTGNGGMMGNPLYGDVAKGLLSGYAVAATDTGHQGSGAAFSIGHPEKMIDWGNRAIHELTVNAKAIVAAHYGAAAKYVYYNGCSTGGRQGWVSAEYYPNDFDGLAIGDPANAMTRLQANNIYINLALNKDEASFIPQAKWNMIHQAVMNQCDALDGAKDGVIENPMACHFNVESLRCKEADASECLTAPQMTALQAVITGSKNPRTGEQLYPGFPLGTTMQPGPVAGKNPDGSAPETFKMLFQDANWDFHTFDFDKDTARADKLGNNTINAVDPAKLKPLFAKGGKILLYHGWDDPAISPLMQLELYQEAAAANGGVQKTADEMRLFLIPGMGHCGHLRQDERPFPMGGAGQGAGPDHRFPLRRAEQGRQKAPCLPVSAGREI
jgi:feruloyl esterase